MEPGIAAEETAASDAALVERSRGGDRDAFGVIVARHQSAICALAYSATGSLNQSEDLAQETFIAAWKNLPQLREPEKLRGWLNGIARNVINNFWRKQGREPIHGAEPLDAIHESVSHEPLPGEQLISREEAQVLWRSLERIPEIYREPLVLFYREHQSIEAVAAALELTEETVRQRLSRGRKLLQEEVLSFVEGALARTSPGKTFTLGVLAGIPIAATSAKAASAGVAAAKAGAVAKGILSMAVFANLFAMLWMIAWPWKTALTETKSRRERRFMARMAWIQIPFVLVIWAIAVAWMPNPTQRPVLYGLCFALFILVLLVDLILITSYMAIRKMQIRLEEGTMMEAATETMEGIAPKKAFKKALNFSIPYLLVMAITGIFMPWKPHWFRCLITLAVQCSPIVWSCWMQYRRATGHTHSAFSIKFQALLTRPVLAVPAIMAGGTLMVGVFMFLIGVDANFLLRFPRPELQTAYPFASLWRTTYHCMVAFGLVSLPVALLVVFRNRLIFGFGNNGGLFASLGKWGRSPAAIIEETHAALFQQLNLEPDQERQLKDLILKSVQATVTRTLPLMNRKMDGAKRASLLQDLEVDRVNFENRIKSLLGETDYQVLEQFNKTVQDRKLVKEFSKKLSRLDRALTAEKEEQVREALTEARAQFPWTNELSRRTNNPVISLRQFSKQTAETFAREEQDFDREFALRVMGLLNPEQFAVFKKVQTSERRSQVTQIKLASWALSPAAKP